MATYISHGITVPWSVSKEYLGNMCLFSRDVIEGGGVTATPKELEEVLLHDLKSMSFGNVNFKG